MRLLVTRLTAKGCRSDTRESGQLIALPAGAHGPSADPSCKRLKKFARLVDVAGAL
jgi:hypothetical protein